MFKLLFYELNHLEQIFAYYLENFDIEVIAIHKFLLLVLFTLVKISRLQNLLI